MNTKTVKALRLGYGILTGLAAIVAGICLMGACLGIYRSGGDQTYTAAKVAQYFAPIATPVYLALALAIGSFILDFLLPRDSRKKKPEKNYGAVLRRLMEKRSLTQGDPQVLQGMLKAENTRRFHWLVSIVLLVAGSVLFLIFGADPRQFGMTGINESMAQAMYIMLPCLGVPFGYAVFAAYYNKVSLQKQADLARQLPIVEKTAAPSVPQGSKSVQIARCILLCVALACLIYGFMAGGTADVLTKAVNICTECVGLG